MVLDLVLVAKHFGESATDTPPPQIPEGMVLIPVGEFQMGSSHIFDAQPVHTVHVDAFYMDKYPVTKAQYVEFLNAKGDRYDRYREHWDWHIVQVGGTYYAEVGYENHPVIRVKWYSAMAYAAWVGKRLPTEAEWEKAARGGLTGKIYPWGDSRDDSKANYTRLNQDHTTAVGTYPPNGYGLYDMAGNAWEWCLDEYNHDFYRTPPSRSPNPIAGANSIEWLISNFRDVHSHRVVRGGYLNRQLVPVAGRFRDRPSSGIGAGTGFRCVKPVSD